MDNSLRVQQHHLRLRGVINRHTMAADSYTGCSSDTARPWRRLRLRIATVTAPARCGTSLPAGTKTCWHWVARPTRETRDSLIRAYNRLQRRCCGPPNANCSDAKAKMHQIRFRLGLTALPRPLCWIYINLYSPKKSVAAQKHSI